MKRTTGQQLLDERHLHGTLRELQVALEEIRRESGIARMLLTRVQDPCAEGFAKIEAMAKRALGRVR